MPKVLYEVRPYLCLAAGAALIVGQNGLVLWLAGFSLYCAGALCWVIRAQFRQRHGRRYPTREYHDLPKGDSSPIDSYQASLALPERVYELLPFGYILAGLVCCQLYLHLIPSYLTAASTSLFLSAGLGVWVLRGYYRGYHRAHAPAVYD